MTTDKPVTVEGILSLLKWTPVIGVAYLAISGDINADRDRADLRKDINHLQQQMSPEKIIKWVVEREHLKRDIQDAHGDIARLQTALKSCKN